MGAIDVNGNMPKWVQWIAAFTAWVVTLYTVLSLVVNPIETKIENAVPDIEANAAAVQDVQHQYHGLRESQIRTEEAVKRIEEKIDKLDR